MIRQVPDEEGILLLSLIPFTNEEKQLVNGKCTSTFTTLVRLGGGTIGGTRASLEKWHKAYYDNFNYLLRTGQFLGKDQDIMAKTCLETDLCLLVSTHDMNWFMLQVDTQYTT